MNEEEESSAEMTGWDSIRQGKGQGSTAKGKGVSLPEKRAEGGRRNRMEAGARDPRGKTRETRKRDAKRETKKSMNWQNGGRSCLAAA